MLVGVAVAVSGVSCAEGRGPDSLDYLGPAVHRLPAKAVYAVLVGPTVESNFHKYTKVDNSWLVFMDQRFQPVGHVHRKGETRARIARFGEGVAFPDRESITAVSPSAVTSTPVETRQLVHTTSAREAGQDALFWLDGSIERPSNTVHTTPVRIGPDGRMRPVSPLEGTWVTSGSCGARQFAVVDVSARGGDGKTPTSGRYQAAELVGDAVRLGPVWNGPESQHGRDTPWTCSDGSAQFYLSDDRYSRPVSGTDVRRIDVSTLATTGLGFGDPDMSEAAFNTAVESRSAVGSGDAWWRDGDAIAYLTSAGDVMRVRAAGAVPQKVYSLNRVMPGRFTVTAVDASSNVTALLWAEGMPDDSLLDQNSSSFLTMDVMSSRSEPVVKAEPEWLRRLFVEQPLSVLDVAVIRP